MSWTWTSASHAVLAVGACLLLSARALAAAPALITVEGVLYDNNDNPVEGQSYDLTFSLYEADAGGAPLAQHVEHDYLLRQGRFAVAMPVAGNPFKLYEQVWLGVQVDQDPEMAPRQQLMSAPYAMEAAHAESADEAASALDLDCAGLGCVGDDELAESYALSEHLHEGVYAAEGHEHDAAYVGVGEVDSVKPGMIAAETISAAHIKPGAVGNQALAENAVTTDQILDGTITTDDVDAGFWSGVSDMNCTGCVGATDIEDGAIQDGDIAAAANIAANKINGTALTMSTTFAGDVSGTYNNLQIGVNAVGGSELADSAVTMAKINNDAVTSTKIANGTISSDDLGQSEVTTNHIKNGTITQQDLAFSAVSAGSTLNINHGNQLVFASADSDTGYLQEVTAPNDNSFELRLTLGDDADASERFTIYGNTTKQHELRADGLAWHAGTVEAGAVTTTGTVSADLLKLAPKSSEPATCDATQAGLLALTSAYRLCVCNGSTWVFAEAGSACTW